MRAFRNPPDVHPPAAAYSHQVELRDVRMLVLSGQIGMAADGTLASGAYEQLDVALENVRRNLQMADMDVADIVNFKMYTVGHWDTDRRREITASFLGEHRPTMTVIGAAALGTPEMLVEVEVTAAQ